MKTIRSLWIALSCRATAACGSGETAGTTNATTAGSGGTGGGMTATTTSVSSSTASTGGGGTGGDGGSGGATNEVLLDTCGDCEGNSEAIAPYFGDFGQPFMRDGDWVGVALLAEEATDVSTIEVDFATSGWPCAALDTGAMLAVVSAVSMPSDMPDANNPGAWGMSIDIPASSLASDGTWTYDLSTAIQVPAGYFLAVAVQMQIVDADNRTCVWAYHTPDVILADFWHHWEAACPDGMPAEVCGWSYIDLSPTPQLGAPLHWRIRARGTLAP